MLASQVQVRTRIYSRCKSLPLVGPRHKQQEMKYQTLTNRVCLMIALLGFAYQSSEISVRYFQRDIISRLDINKTDAVYPPALHICSHLGYSELDDLTIGSLLEATPTVSQAMSGCQLRIPDSYLKLDINSSVGCLDHMEAVKFTRHHQTCYRFSLDKKYLEQSYRHSAQSLVNRGLLYEIRLNKAIFKDMDEYDIEFTNNMFPPLTFTVAGRIYTDATAGIRPKTSFLTSYSLYTNHMLQAPYPSNCIWYTDRNAGTNSKAECVEKCKLTESIRLLDRVPFTAYISDTMANLQHMRILSISDLRNVTRAKIFSDIEERCMRRPECQHNNCFDELMVAQPLVHRRTNSIEFEVYAPREPYYETYMYARLVLLDYVIYLASSVGFWLGYAVLDTVNLVMAISKQFKK
ncbi:hypothetical protein HDE_11191 [Halotydeus destructor]|nr:hypothetical protein HDE_11191 [Halotydeus destructor]